MANTRKEYQKQWYQKNWVRVREKQNTQHKLKQETDKKSYLLQNAKKRAKKIGRMFNISVDDFEIPDFCPILHRPFKHKTPYSASLDRIDSNLGYIKGNIQVISRRANTMKSNASIEDLQRFAQWVLKTYPL